MMLPACRQSWTSIAGTSSRHGGRASALGPGVLAGQGQRACVACATSCGGGAVIIDSHPVRECHNTHEASCQLNARPYRYGRDTQQMQLVNKTTPPHVSKQPAGLPGAACGARPWISRPAGWGSLGQMELRHKLASRHDRGEGSIKASVITSSVPMALRPLECA